WLFVLSHGPIASADGEPDGVVVSGWAALRMFTAKWLGIQEVEGNSGDDSLTTGRREVTFSGFAQLALNWPAAHAYTIAYDPYQAVDWDRWHWALAQHHDHMGRLSLDRINAYDRAGYNVVVTMDYAGKKSRGTTYCDYRLWPVHKYLSGVDSDQEVVSAMNNIRLFIPSMEEIGCHHITSSFLTTYIELWEPDFCDSKERWHYERTQQCIDLINLYGGMAIIAHPTASANVYMAWRGYKGIEIVNAYHYRQWLLNQENENAKNQIEHFQAVWDYLLTHKDTRIWGFAVNDWYGPWRQDEQPWIDCGKILVAVPEYSIDDYRNSLETGCFFAIHDWAVQRKDKDRYPVIIEIVVTRQSIYIQTDGEVTWIANGERVAYGHSINLSQLSHEQRYRYLRAEISNDYGTVYTQPWTVASFAQ
ncbi:MAG: hypothetical protein JSU70_01615, partial [Phycisphaerales bacterium]